MNSLNFFEFNEKNNFVKLFILNFLKFGFKVGFNFLYNLLDLFEINPEYSTKYLDNSYCQSVLKYSVVPFYILFDFSRILCTFLS